MMKYDNEHLKKLVNKLMEENRSSKSADKDLKESYYVAKAEVEIKRLKESIDNVIYDNIQLESDNKDLYIENKAFFKSNNELHKQVRRLKDYIATLEDKIEELKNHE